MVSYIAHFIVYTLAMSGLICFALFVYKKFMHGGFTTKGAKTLSIEETMNINPRKSLMIVKAGSERFLIASDTDKTTLISKLNDNSFVAKNNNAPIVANIVDKDLERFKDIIKIAKNENIENLDMADFVAPINKTTKKVTNIKTAKTKKSPTKSPVHLEVITDINPDMPMRNGRRTQYTTKNHGKKVNIEVGKTKSHGFSTMKEMATKVYEL